MICAVTNNKGGVGKTSITINLAHALANKGKKVLIIDHDPQCNTSTTILSGNTVPNTIYSMYAENLPAEQCVYPTPYENMDIISNSSKTDTLEIELYQDTKKSYLLLNEKIADLRNQYDFIFIDTPPNLGLWVLMALIAADTAIIPITAGSRYAIEGFIAAYDTIQTISNRVNPRLRFLKAIINKVDKRTSVSKIAMEHIRRQFGDKVFECTIPICTDIEKAEAEQVTLLRHAPQSSAAKRFRALADELSELLEMGEK